MVGLLLLAALALAPDIITVDDDGPAQFASIDDAVHAALPGDVSLVPGATDGPFRLDRDLSVLVPGSGPRPHVSGFTTVLDVDSVTLAGLDFANLWLSKVHGRGVIDDCTMGVWTL